MTTTGRTVRDAAAGVDAVFMITPSVHNQVELAPAPPERADGRWRAAAGQAVGDRRRARGRPVLVREHSKTEGHIAASGIPATILRPNSFMTRMTCAELVTGSNSASPWITARTRI